MENRISDSELLSFLIENDMLDLTAAEHKMNEMNRQKYLDSHNSAVWQGANGRWFTYLNTPSGRRQVSSNSKESLEDKIIDHYQERAESPTLEQAFNQWVDERISYNEISKGTYDRYVNDFKRFFKDSNIREHKIKYIGEDELDIFIRSTIARLELTQKAYSSMRTIIRGVFKYAKRKKFTDLSISTFFQDLDLSKRAFRRTHQDAKSQIFLVDEIPRLIKWLDEHPRVSNYGVILALQTGLRTGELAALKYSDLEGDMLHVQRMEIKYKDEKSGTLIHEIVDHCKTDKGDRYIYLTESALTTIKKIRMLNPFGEYMMTEKGKRVQTNTYNDRLKLACKKLGIPVRSMHKLRKTYGTTLIDNGVDESLIMNQMGHKDISTTRKYYYFANKDSDAERKQIRGAINY